MAQERFVTREEFDTVRADTQRLSIRMEVLTHDVHRFELRFGDFIEQVDKRFDRLEDRMDGLEARMDKLEARMDKLEARLNQLETNLVTAFKSLEATVLAAVSQLTPRN